MANRRRETVSYRRLELSNTLPEGLLPVAREGGDLERRVASGLFRIAGIAGEAADRKAARDGARAGQRDALDGAPGRATVAGGETTPLTGSDDLRAIVADAARRHGVPVSAMFITAQLESGWDPAAQNPNSSAGGLFQQLDANANDYGVANRFDAYESADGAARFMADNMRALQRRLGRPPTDGELYLAHQQGGQGAINLLTNAGRPATAIVGADAVRLNGGADGMTAGEFANLWISKAEGVSLPDLPDAAGVVPVAHQAPGVVPAGSGGRFRPSGQDTVWGRAYDAAGTRTYLQMLDTTMRADMAAVYARDKDDPARLRASMDALLTVHLDKNHGHVFPEIEADYRVAFARQRQGYELQADRDAERRRDDENRAGFIERTNRLNTDLAQRLAAFDADNPAAAAAIAGAQRAIDDHYDAAVAHGIMDAHSAAEAKIVARRTAATGFYRRQADPLDADGVAALRRTLQADFSAGRLDGVDGAGWESLDAELTALERRKRTGDSGADRAYQQRADRFTARVAAGFDVDPGAWSQFTLDASTAPNGERIHARAAEAVRLARITRDEPLADTARRLRDMRAALGRNPTDDQLAAYRFAADAHERKRMALGTDPVGFGEASGLVPPSAGIADLQGVDGLDALIAERVIHGRTVADHFGVAPRYLRPGEAAQIKALMAADPATGAAVAGAIVTGAGEAAPDVLRELGDAAPEATQAGAIIAGGGSAQAAIDVLAGHGKDDTGRAYKAVDNAVRSGRADAIAGDALVLQPGDRTRIDAAAHAIARKRLADAGAEADSADGRAIIDRALQEAAGAIFEGDVQWGGFGRTGTGWFDRRRPGTVLVPNTIRADMFDQVVAAIRPEDLAGLDVWPVREDGEPVSAGYLTHARPVAVRGGHAFAFGDPASEDPQWVRGSDGGVFVLDVNAMRDTLVPRVPGAFRGW